MARKYGLVFSVCPVPGCETTFDHPYLAQIHFKHHIAWEKAQGCVALFNSEGTVKGFLREKA